MSFAGSIKWRERAPFDKADLRALAEHRSGIPGIDLETRLVGVSRAGFHPDLPRLDVRLGPAELVEAWR